MGSVSVGPQLDDTELEDELEALQQQDLEDKMLETGAVPVDSIQRLPTVANGESKFIEARVAFVPVRTLLILFKSRARHPWLPRTTRKRSSGGCKPRWLCKREDLRRNDVVSLSLAWSIRPGF